MAQYFGSDPIIRLRTQVVRINPDTLQCSVIAAYDGDTFGVGTTATQIDGEIWVGSARSGGVARFSD